MKSPSWFRSTAGLLRVELRGAFPMGAGLMLAAAILLLVARAQFEVAPEALIRGRGTAWALAALAIMIPLAAELFGSSGRAVGTSTLQPLPARRLQVFAAKWATLAGYIVAAWLALAAADLTLDLRYPRTKIRPNQPHLTTWLLFGAAGLALFVSALSAATIRNALGSTMLGLVTLILIGGPVIQYMDSSGRVAGMESWALSAAAIAIHPLVLGLALVSLFSAFAMRGRASGNGVSATMLRSTAVVALCVAAPVAALAASAMSTMRTEPIAYDDPDAIIYSAIPSPDASQLAVNVSVPIGAQHATSWIVEIETGEVRQVITPREAAASVPFGSARVWVKGWSPDGEALSLDINRSLPWLDPSGTLRLRDKRFAFAAPTEWSHREMSRWRHVDYDGYDEAVDRFNGASCDDAVAALKELAPQYLLVPRLAPGVAFGFSKDMVPHRIDGATGVQTSIDHSVASPWGDYRVDPFGVWIAPSAKPLPPVVNSITGETMQVPEGWFPSRSSYYDMIVRDDAILVCRERVKNRHSEADWAWLRGGVLGDVLTGLDAREIIDLDGDRMVAVSGKKIELLDRNAKPIRTLRAPGEGE